jgi:hypothetical protein
MNRIKLISLQDRLFRLDVLYAGTEDDVTPMLRYYLNFEQ